MKKFAVSLLALAAISTASFAAAGDGADTDSPAVYNDYLPNGVSASGNSFVADEALSTGVKSSTNDANYINKSQLR